MTWNISEFYQLAQQQLSPQDKLSLEHSLGSVVWKFLLCRYHIKEANLILSEMFTWPEEKRSAEAAGKLLNWAAGTDEGQKFAKACFYSEAHVIAFAQSLHSTADILAKVLYISLDLNRYLTENNLYLETVVKYMKKHGIAPLVITAANSFLGSVEFQYLKAYVNTTKHTSLILSKYSIGLVPGQEKHGLMFNAFSYKSRSWPQKWVTDFIEVDFERLSSMFGAIGLELTTYIYSQQSP